MTRRAGRASSSPPWGARTPMAGSSTAWAVASRRSPRSASSGRRRAPTRTWTTRSARSRWTVPGSTGAATAGTCRRPSDPLRWTRGWSKRPDPKASSSSTTPTPASSFDPGSRWRTGARPSKGRPRFPVYPVLAPQWISSSSTRAGRARARSSPPATSSTSSRSKAWEAFRSRWSMRPIRSCSSMRATWGSRGRRCRPPSTTGRR